MPQEDRPHRLAFRAVQHSASTVHMVGDRTGKAFNDPARKYKGERPKPDLHGILPDGTRVNSVRRPTRAHFERHGDDALRSIVKNLMIYALGRPLGRTDDEIIQTIIDNLKTQGHGAPRTSESLVFSPAFLENEYHELERHPP